MEPKTSIKQHDFISGEPKNKYFVYRNPFDDDVPLRFIPCNPCGEIPLGEPQRTVLHFDTETEGFGQGELGVTMAPPGVGKTGILTRMLETLREERRVVNFDFESLYPHIHHTVPQGVTRREDVDPNMPLRDFIEMGRRQQQIEEERVSREQIDFVNKLTLNSFY